MPPRAGGGDWRQRPPVEDWAAMAGEEGLVACNRDDRRRPPIRPRKLGRGRLNGDGGDDDDTSEGEKPLAAAGSSSSAYDEAVD